MCRLSGRRGGEAVNPQAQTNAFFIRRGAILPQAPGICAAAVNHLLHPLLYWLQLASIAALLPLLGGRFEDSGVDGFTIGALMATLPAGRLLAAPLWAMLADRYRLAGAVMRVATIASALAGVALARAESIQALALCMFTFSAMRAPIGPILDAFVFRDLHERGRPAGEYGRVRLWGSLGFLCGVVLASLAPRFGWPPYLVADAMLLGSAAVSFALPWQGEGGPAPILPALKVLASEKFFWPLLCAGSLQALTMSVYDTFYSVHVASLGLPGTIVGASVALGVGCEVVLMAFAKPLIARLGLAKTLLMATLSGVPRWLLTAWTADPTLLVVTQALHGIGFAAFWLAGVQRMSQSAPRSIAASAQSLWAAATYGFGALLGALLAGASRHYYGSSGIFLMTAGVAVLASGSALWLVRVDDAER